MPEDDLNSNMDAPSLWDQAQGYGTNALNSFFSKLGQNAAGQVIPPQPPPPPTNTQIPGVPASVSKSSGAGTPAVPATPIDWTKWGLIAVGGLVVLYIGIKVAKVV